VLLDFVNLKPTESEYKIGIIVAADRMNEQAAMHFLRPWRNPPAKSILGAADDRVAANSGDDFFALLALEFWGGCATGH